VGFIVQFLYFADEEMGGVGAAGSEERKWYVGGSDRMLHAWSVKMCLASRLSCVANIRTALSRRSYECCNGCT